ncbi:hypothetical protein MTR67_038307 [Solanum verrucosum]|uniref:Uncharacterized protein n=1 Tax=Solanum verrucosum TaxID=315347 RepID=A0AAF0UFA0_SOLVR|nr:hypothetical protein MTR67_038307 [Solanum verrucosum]
MLNAEGSCGIMGMNNSTQRLHDTTRFKNAQLTGFMRKLEITNRSFLLQLRKKLELFWDFLCMLPNRRQASEKVRSLPEVLYTASFFAIHISSFYVLFPNGRNNIRKALMFSQIVQKSERLVGSTICTVMLNKNRLHCGNMTQNTFTNIIKDKVGETSTLRNEEGLEVDDRDMERNTTTNGEDEGEKTSEDEVNLLKMVSEEQLLKTWIETVGGTKKEKYMGLNPSNIPTQQIFETPKFQQLLDRVLEQRMTNMQDHVQMEIRENMEAQVTIAVRAAMAQMLGVTPQPPPDGSGSTPNP